MATEQSSGRSVFANLDELRAHAGAELGASSWREIDQAAIDGFADVTGDHQWIHTDPERAASGPFGATIAHGYLTLSLCASFMEEILTIETTGMAVNYGLNKVRFPAPVPVGSRVRGVARLAAVEDASGGAAQAVIAMTVEVEGAPKPACVAEMLIRFYG